jgi:hypothetical protein
MDFGLVRLIPIEHRGFLFGWAAAGTLVARMER